MAAKCKTQITFRTKTSYVAPKSIQSQSMWRQTIKSRVSTYSDEYLVVLVWPPARIQEAARKSNPRGHDILVLTSWSIPDNNEPDELESAN